jgi:hypothetical protein
MKAHYDRQLFFALTVVCVLAWDDWSARQSGHRALQADLSGWKIPRVTTVTGRSWTGSSLLRRLSESAAADKSLWSERKATLRCTSTGASKPRRM